MHGPPTSAMDMMRQRAARRTRSLLQERWGADGAPRLLPVEIVPVVDDVGRLLQLLGPVGEEPVLLLAEHLDAHDVALAGVGRRVERRLGEELDEIDAARALDRPGDLARLQRADRADEAEVAADAGDKPGER